MPTIIFMKLQDVDYQAKGETGSEQKKKPGDPLSRYERGKELTYEESLQYQIELLKRELVRKDAEVLRLKKRNAKGAMPKTDDPANVYRNSNSTATKMSSTHQQVIAACLKNAM